MLRHCVHAEYFIIELNERIEGYDFGSNSPVPIDPKLLSKPNKTISFSNDGSKSRVATLDC